MDKVMSRMKRLQEYADPSHSEWRGQSTKENIDRMAARATRETTGHKTRAKSGDVKLPSTGEMNVHSTHVRAGDARAEAKADRNHVNKLTEYFPSLRRES
jgi:hypothetical protein